MRTSRGMMLVAVAAAALAVVPSAPAKDGDVIKRGSCSASSDWKLKLSPEDGRIEVEFEVDQNRIGARWRVRLFRDGVLVFDRVLTTTAPSGSFEARKVVANPRGSDTVTGRARNLRTSELCRGSAAAAF